MIGAVDRETAVQMGQDLIDTHFGHHIKHDEVFQDAEVYYRLLEDAETSALNGGTVTHCEPRLGMIIIHINNDDGICKALSLANITILSVLIFYNFYMFVFYSFACSGVLWMQKMKNLPGGSPELSKVISF